MNLFFFHDYNLRKFNRKEEIKDLTSNQLKKIDIGFGLTIPLLDELLDKYSNKFLLNIEIKFNLKGEKELAKLISSYDINLTFNNIIVSFFHQKPLLDIKLTNKEISTGFLTTISRINIKTLKKKMQCDIIHPYYEITPIRKIPIIQILNKKLINHYTEKLVRLSQNYGLHINIWTINSTEYLIKVFNLGIFGIITDNVEKAQSIQKKTLSQKSE